MHNSSQTPICIYHHNCMDGFTSAWIVKQHFGENVEFYGGVHNDPPPDVTGRDVILVDFCYKADVMVDIVRKASHVTILDHHATAKNCIDAIYPLVKDKITTVLDMSKSGAMITWEYYFPQETPPDFVRYVQDADLWLFKLPNSKEVLMNVASYEYDFDNWSLMMQQDISSMALEGSAILRKHMKDVKELSQVNKRHMSIGGYSVPVINLPYTLVSDAASIASQGNPFAACYWDTPNGRVFGLRSQSNGIDVSVIAEQYGGGGHKHASGFRVDYKDLERLGLQ